MGDPLDAVLETLKIRTTLFAMERLAGRWGVSFPEQGPARNAAYFHAVDGAACWLRLAGRDDLIVGDGDVVLLAHGSRHAVVSEPGGIGLVDFDATTWVPNSVTAPVTPADDRTGAPTTTLVCGAVDVPGAATHPLLGLLPEVVVFPAGDEEGADLSLTLTLLRRESRASSPGGGTLLARLGDVLLVQLLRTWMKRQNHPAPGWLGALRDPHLAAALNAIHDRPAGPWTVEALAAQASMSRSQFAARFTAEVGVSPLAYVTDWRLATANRLLGDGASIRETARRVGYTSEPAFSRAFSRRFGQPPSQVRAGAMDPSAGRPSHRAGIGDADERPSPMT